MWNDIQLDPKQVKTSLRRNCENLENQLYLYDKKIFREMEDARHLYGSLRIENTSLTFVQTSMVLRGEIPRSDGWTNRDLREAIALRNALVEMRSLIDTAPFSEVIVKRIHKTASDGLLDVEHCGQYRDKMNYIGGGFYSTATPNQIEKLMRRLFQAIANEENPIIKAAFFSFNYLSIHPFADFNGRTSRLFECYLLGEAGYPFISLREAQIEEYMNLLKEGQEAGKAYFEPYVEFIYKRVEERFEEIEEGLNAE